MSDILSVWRFIKVGKDERVNIEPSVSWKGDGCDLFKCACDYQIGVRLTRKEGGRIGLHLVAMEEGPRLCCAGVRNLFIQSTFIRLSYC